jgi:hypothetical protein
MSPPERIQRLRTPRADQLGERTKRRCLGRAMSPRDGTRQPPRCRTHVPEPGPRFPASGISAHKARCPARLPRIRFDSRSWANWFAGHHHRGDCAGLSTVAFPEHPSAREMTRGLVQTGGLARRSTLQLVRPCGVPRVQRQDASNPLLQPTFRVTSTRDKHHLWRLPAETPWETRRLFDIETDRG